MKHDRSTQAWNRVGEEWIQLVQISEHRTQFIMPHMLNKLQKRGSVDREKVWIGMWV